MHTLIIAVLKRLADGEFQSVEVLARCLAVSPAAVSAALQEATRAGLALRYVAGRGYRLDEALDWLDAASIEAALARAGLSVRVVAVCDSTNAQMLAEARRGAPSGQVLAAEWQTQGRGRLGRTWHSGVCSALTFSLLWRFERPLSALTGLSLAVGVAIARALRRHDLPAQLKWPNDLQWQGHKLGGILIEVHGDASGPCAAVIGIGINVRLRAAERACIDQPTADLHEAGAPALSRSAWLAAMLMELHAVLRQFARDGFAPLRAQWNRYHAHAGARVELALANGDCVHGIATGVDDCGRLLLATAEGTHAAMAGEISLRVSP